MPSVSGKIIDKDAGNWIYTNPKLYEKVAQEFKTEYEALESQGN